MAFTRLLTNLLSDRLADSRDFYLSLLGFEVNDVSDWYVQLRSPTVPQLELGIIARSSELVPVAFQQVPAGI